jgi:hypothetical protein
VRKKKTAAHSKNKKVSAGGALWFDDSFDQLHRDHLLIMKSVGQVLKNTDKLHDEHVLIMKKIEEIPAGSDTLDPELEEQVRKAGGLAESIDEKVPD